MNFAVIISSFLSGMLGAMGVGGGGVLIVYLTSYLAFEQKAAQGINLIFFLLTGIVALIGNSRKGLINRKELKSFILPALPGLITGFLLLNIVNADTLKKIFAAGLLIIGIKALFDKKH